MSILSPHSKDWRQKRNRAIATSIALACSVILFAFAATMTDYWTGLALYATLVALLLAVTIADHAEARSDGSGNAPVVGSAVVPRHRLRSASRRPSSAPRYLRLR